MPEVELVVMVDKVVPRTQELVVQVVPQPQVEVEVVEQPLQPRG